MLAQLIALGVFTSTPGGGGTGDTGVVIATSERTAVLTAVQDSAARSSGIALGAGVWRQQYDPADHTPYALDFSALLDGGENIVEIEAITMNATAALLGVGIDAATGYAPIIDEGGKKVQVWFAIDEASWSLASFDAGGVQLPVTIRVATDAIPPKRYERTGVLPVRQL